MKFKKNNSSVGDRVERSNDGIRTNPNAADTDKKERKYRFPQDRRFANDGREMKVCISKIDLPFSDILILVSKVFAAFLAIIALLGLIFFLFAFLTSLMFS